MITNWKEESKICGIVGILKKSKSGINYTDQKIFEQLLFADTLRGADSTGVFGFNYSAGDEVYVHKTATPAAEFLDSDGWDIMDNNAVSKCRALVGHNRSATRGAVSGKNAHPFHHGKIVLLHNGTLKTWYDLKKGNNSIDVDSEAICYALSLANHWKEVLPIIDGAFAMVWYDLEKKSMFIANNGERPLWYAREKDGSLFFASEYQMLAWVLSRNNVKLDTDNNGHSFFAHPAESVLEIPFDYEGKFEDLKFQKFKKKLPQKAVATTTYSLSTVTKGATDKSKSKVKNKFLPDSVRWLIDKKEVVGDHSFRLTGKMVGNAKIKVSVIGPIGSLGKFVVGDTVISTPTSTNHQTGTIHTACDLDFVKTVNNYSTTTVNGTVIYEVDWLNYRSEYKECCMCFDKLTFAELSGCDVSTTESGVPEYIICQKCLNGYQH